MPNLRESQELKLMLAEERLAQVHSAAIWSTKDSRERARAPVRKQTEMREGQAGQQVTLVV